MDLPIVYLFYSTLNGKIKIKNKGTTCSVFFSLNHKEESRNGQRLRPASIFVENK
ncbi:hypothetical protein P9858_09685 [Niallia circulans]|uniref:hypothetical protein n=1 Tax=Niallia circulans TaxID=1397 RepID=UPI00164272BD|nr:hypothetical protein [Niallia circulans]MED5100398.1 hypothetical protein [Niallia circulans]